MDTPQVILTEDNQFVLTETGELLDKESMKKLYQDKIVRDVQKSQEEMIAMGIESDIQLLKFKNINYSVVKVKENYSFGKVYRVSVKNLLEQNNLSVNALAFIARFEPYISFPTNSIVVNGQHPSSEIIEHMMNLKRTSIYKTLKELEENDVIRKLNINGAMMVLFNPFLYASGTIITKSTYDLFEKSIYNPKNNNEECRD